MAISEKLKGLCSQLYQGVPPPYQWQWDDRFNAALVVLEKDDKDAILETISKVFNQQWDSSSIGKASPGISKLVNNVFGIEPGQLLFSADEDAGLLLYAAWWPWGNGENFSLRAGVFPIDNQDLDDDEIAKILQGWFNI